MQEDTTIIDAKTRLNIDLKELYESRQLLYFFIWRNFKIRYKQTLIGAAWAVLQPLILMVVFTIFFNQLAGIESGSVDVPYPIFTFAGLMFWGYFSGALSQASNSLLSFQGVIKKIYFPRILAPLSASLTGLIDFGFSLIVYIGLMAFYGIAPSAVGVALFLPMVLLSVLTALGIGLFLAAINIKYRDVQQVLPFFIQSLLFVTPVIYPVSLVSEGWQWILFLNPMTGVIETMRAGLLGLGDVPWVNLGVSVAATFLYLFIGVRYFNKKEREFADLI